MTYLISRANYQRCTEGMTDAQRRDFDRDFMQYPEKVSPDGWIDTERIADRYTELVAGSRAAPPPALRFAEQQPTWWPRGWPKDLTSATADAQWCAAQPTWWPRGRELAEPAVEVSPAFVSCARGNGKSSWRPPQPWDEIGQGMFVAPPGTPMPFYTPDPGPAPPIAELVEDAWSWGMLFRRSVNPSARGGELMQEWAADGEVDELMQEWAADSAGARREFINQWVPAVPADPLGDMLAWWRKYRDMRLPPPQQLRAGENALAAISISVGGRTAPLHAWDNAVDLTGVPIVADPDLPADVWRLVDANTGDTLLEGVISDGLSEYLRVIRESVDQLADQCDIPRDLLY